MTSKYEGEATVTLLDDGRNVRLESELVFIDADSLRWPVPKGAVVDGASIPKLFWSVIGGPFEGKYRKASIIHDWFCDRRTRSWQATHKVFYEAMLASQVLVAHAKIMYFTVLRFGPRWDERVTINNNIENAINVAAAPVVPIVTVSFVAVAALMVAGITKITVSVPNPGDATTDDEKTFVVELVAKQITDLNISIMEIEKLAELNTEALIAQLSR